MKYIKPLLKFLILLISIIVMSEVYLRVFHNKSFRIWQYPLIYKPDSLLGHTYIPNSKAFKKNDLYESHFSINSHGFIRKDFTTQKSKNTFRVIFVGASDLVGFETNGPNCFTKIVENNIRKHKLPIEIINLGIDGIQGVQMMNLIRKRAIKYKPDLILFDLSGLPLKESNGYRTIYRDYVVKYSNYNDPLDSLKTYINEKFYTNNSFTFLFNFYLYRAFCKYSFNHPNAWVIKNLEKMGVKIDPGKSKAFQTRYIVNSFGKKGEFRGYTIKESLSLLKNLQDELAQKNIDFCVFDYFKNPQMNIYAYLYYSTGINFIPMKATFKEEYSFGEQNGHLSQAGHKIVADSLYFRIIKNITKDFKIKQITRELY